MFIRIGLLRSSAVQNDGLAPTTRTPRLWPSHTPDGSCLRSAVGAGLVGSCLRSAVGADWSRLFSARQEPNFQGEQYLRPLTSNCFFIKSVVWRWYCKFGKPLHFPIFPSLLRRAPLRGEKPERAEQDPLQLHKTITSQKLCSAILQWALLGALRFFTAKRSAPEKAREMCTSIRFDEQFRRRKCREQ